MGLEKSNSVLTDLRASAKACELTCVEIIEQIELYVLKVINPEFRKAMDTFRKSSELTAFERVKRFHGHISILALEETRQDAETLAHLQGKAGGDLAQSTLDLPQDHQTCI